MYRIGKRFTFEAAHRLPLPDGHKCARLHGHSYTAEVTVAGPQLDSAGFVVDFAVLDQLCVHLGDQFDHRDLNDVVAVPSSERLARYLFDWCTSCLDLPGGVRVEAVRVSETTRTWAEYRPELP